MITHFCPSCWLPMGQGMPWEQTSIWDQHQAACKATTQDHMSALYRLHFDEMTKGLSL